MLSSTKHILVEDFLHFVSPAMNSGINKTWRALVEPSLANAKRFADAPSVNNPTHRLNFLFGQEARIYFG